MVGIVLVMTGWRRLRQVLQEVDWHIVSSDDGWVMCGVMLWRSV
jgi:hypothetical protein